MSEPIEELILSIESLERSVTVLEQSEELPLLERANLISALRDYISSQKSLLLSIQSL